MAAIPGKRRGVEASFYIIFLVDPNLPAEAAINGRRKNQNLRTWGKLSHRQSSTEIEHGMMQMIPYHPPHSTEMLWCYLRTGYDTG